MVKVITYGTYDLLHYGHIRLLERAKALGDYLIVGVTSDDFDKQRGKINVQQTLEDRIEAVRRTGIADKIIVEEYEGQKIDDIKRYGVDIFTVGSDWEGHFDYLNEFCKVEYLSRTKGVSSTEIRGDRRSLRIGLSGYSSFINRVFNECTYVNGAEVKALHAKDVSRLSPEVLAVDCVTSNYSEMLDSVDAVYIHSVPSSHYDEVKEALLAGKHVMCESPIAMTKAACEELFNLADRRQLVLLDSLRTAYSTAYARMLLLVKSGRIGKVVSIDATCTSLESDVGFEQNPELCWGSMNAWGPTAMLPIFQILGDSYEDVSIVTRSASAKTRRDDFTEIVFRYQSALATVKVGTGVKSEGSLVVAGTEGYIYVPAPWWKTEYFEIRYENPADNRRYFYQLDGEGIRYEWVTFLKMIDCAGKGQDTVDVVNREGKIARNTTLATCGVIERFLSGDRVIHLQR